MEGREGAHIEAGLFTSSVASTRSGIRLLGRARPAGGRWEDGAGPGSSRSLLGMILGTERSCRQGAVC